MTERRSSRPVWLGEDQRRWDHVRVHLQVLRDVRIDAYGLAIYLGLAAHAEVSTGSARPSIETLAGYGGMSARKAASVVGELVDAGYVTVEHRAGKASRYALLPPPPLHDVHGSDDAEVGTTCAPPLHVVPPTPAPRADELEPVNENQGPEEHILVDAGALVPGFDEFWTRYPKRNGKRLGRGDAERVWSKRTAAERAAIMLAVDHYRDACDRRLTIAKDAHRWLAGAWRDWDAPAVDDRAGQPVRRGIIEDRDAASGRIEL